MFFLNLVCNIEAVKHFILPLFNITSHSNKPLNQPCKFDQLCIKLISFFQEQAVAAVLKSNNM